MNVSVRLRLTLIYAALLAGALLTLAGVLRVLLVRNLYTELDTEIVSVTRGAGHLLGFEIAEAEHKGESHIPPIFLSWKAWGRGCICSCSTHSGAPFSSQPT
jgi:ABC-type Fe3+-siderophore transport system permease subunit